MGGVKVEKGVCMGEGVLGGEVSKVGVSSEKGEKCMLLILCIYEGEDKQKIELLEKQGKIKLIGEIKGVKGVGDGKVMGEEY